LALAGLALAAAQPLVFQAGCTLCLVLTLCSLVLVVLAHPEVAAATKYFREERRRGATVATALAGASS
jgi:hypothetical protein